MSSYPDTTIYGVANALKPGDKGIFKGIECVVDYKIPTENILGYMCFGIKVVPVGNSGKPMFFIYGPNLLLVCGESHKEAYEAALKDIVEYSLKVRFNNRAKIYE